MTRVLRRLVPALVIALVAGLLTAPAGFAAPGGGSKGPKTPPTTTPGPKTLVLYDTTGDYGKLGELYGIQVANLVSHFNQYTAKPVVNYTAGELANYNAVVYAGSTYDEPLPAAFLDDVLATTKPVVWMYDNIWQLTARAPDFATRYGWNWSHFDASEVTQVRYKGATLTRSALNAGGIMAYSTVDPALVTEVATAMRSDGTTFPWAVRSKNLTYLGELPFPYASESDRKLIFEDVLFDALAPSTAERHRALVRLEDVGPDADPVKLRTIADYLSSKGVPFSVAVYTEYHDPNGTYNNGVPEVIEFKDVPAVVDALKYMVSKGGTLLMHGYTHQFSNVANPYNGASGDDFEFYRAHIDANDYVVYDGPVPGDSAAWASSRIDAALQDFKSARLPAPTIFEFPHHAGSAVDYEAIGPRFAARYERALYFSGLLSGQPVDYTRMVGQFFPYTVKDLYGDKVLPDNIGDYSPVEMNNHPPRFAADLINNAKANLVVRDGVASFYYHPFFGLDQLPAIVEGIQALGYTFVAAGSL